MLVTGLSLPCDARYGDALVFLSFRGNMPQIGLSCFYLWISGGLESRKSGNGPTRMPV